MFSNSSDRMVLSFAGALALLVIASPLSLADNFEDGVKYFTKRDFTHAAVFFDKAVQDTPWDAKVLYYQAVTRQYNRDFKGATQVYERIVDKFPGTDACKNAEAALRVLDPAFLKKKGASTEQSSGSPAASAAGSAAGSSLGSVDVQAPSQTRIPFTRSGSAVMIDGYVNNRMAHFEFSGDETLMSAKDATALGLSDHGHAPAAGAKIAVSLKVGDISEKNFPVTIMDIPHPKLGDDFFSKFSYSQESNYLAVNKRGGGVARAGWDVPFRKRGNDVMLRITVNGRNCEVMFDKDAGECIVPRGQVRQFGLDVDESTQMNRFIYGVNNGPLRGEPGYGDMVTTASATAKVVVGPVSNPEARFKIDDKAHDAKVGPSIFGGWHYDIDPGASVIHLSR